MSSTCSECVYFDEHGTESRTNCAAPLPFTVTGLLEHFPDSLFCVDASTDAEGCDAFCSLGVVRILSDATPEPSAQPSPDVTPDVPPEPSAQPSPDVTPKPKG